MGKARNTQELQQLESELKRLRAKESQHAESKRAAAQTKKRATEDLDHLNNFMAKFDTAYALADPNNADATPLAVNESLDAYKTNNANEKQRKITKIETDCNTRATA